MTPLSPTYRRSDDHGAKARELTNDPRGAPYYMMVQEAIRKHKNMKYYGNQILFYQDMKEEFMKVCDNHGFCRYTIAKPKGVSFSWRVRMALEVLKGHAFACHWQ